ncbi:MAG: helix-turn-helix domain-containing protein [Fimbriiglobus sp.]
MKSSVKSPKTATKKPNSPKATISVEAGSGNVFADIGVAKPEMALVKAGLVQKIQELIEEQGLTQVRAAKLLGLDQPKVSALIRGRTSGYTTDRLFRFLNLLGQGVEITISPLTDRRLTAETRVVIKSLNQSPTSSQS